MLDLLDSVLRTPGLFLARTNRITKHDKTTKATEAAGEEVPQKTKLNL